MATFQLPAAIATQLPLEAKIIEITCTPGDDLNFSFSAPVDMTGWAMKFEVWLSNDDGDGPTGDALASLTGSPGLVLTPGATSTIAIKVAAEITADRRGVILWCRLQRTDTGSVRTFAKGQILPA